MAADRLTAKGAAVPEGDLPVLSVLPEITRAELVRVQPGDVLLFTFAKYLSDAEHEVIHSNLAGAFPGVRIAIVEGDVTVSVVRDETGGGQ